MSTPRRMLALVAVAAVLSVSCSGDPNDQAAPTTSASVATSTAPPSSTSSTTEGATTSTAAGAEACATAEDPLPPSGATDVSEVEADVDGDGRADHVVAYRLPEGNRKVAVELAAGGSASVDASGSSIDGPAPLSALGGVDLGGDGQTVLAVTSGGASVVVVGLFQFVECALARVMLASGEPAEFPVGGTVTHADGLACRDDTLVRLSASSTDGETFSATETSFRVDGNTLVEVGTDQATLSRAGDDAELERYSTITCAELERGL